MKSIYTRQCRNFSKTRWQDSAESRKPCVCGGTFKMPMYVQKMLEGYTHRQLTAFSSQEGKGCGPLGLSICFSTSHTSGLAVSRNTELLSRPPAFTDTGRSESQAGGRVFPLALLFPGKGRGMAHSPLPRTMRNGETETDPKRAWGQLHDVPTGTHTPALS